MSAAQTAYSGQKLAQFLGITERAVQIRAKRENWQSAPRPGRGGGSLWLLTSMPEKTRLAIAAAVVAQMAKEAERPSKTQTVNTISKLTPSKQDRAEARAMAVQMARRFAEQSGQSRTVAYEVFAWRYNSGELLSVPLWVRETLPQLCRASLCNWENFLLKEGLERLGGKHGQHRKGTGAVEQPYVLGYCLAHIYKFPHARASQIYKSLEARLALQSERTEKLPSLRRLQAWYKAWRKDNEELFTFISNPDAWRSKFRVAFGDADGLVERLNQEWEMDSTPSDLILADGKRHTIVACIDVYSRRVKFHVSRTSTSHAVATCLRKSILDWGVPEITRTDNGADYVARYMERVFLDMQIVHDTCHPFSPEEKPFVERVFKSFLHDNMELLTGFTGHSVSERKALEARKSFASRMMEKDEKVELNLTPEELQAVCDQWANNTYMHRKHSKLGMSPYEKLLAYEGEVRTIENAAALGMLFLPLQEGEPTRKVRKKAVHLLNDHYISETLGLYAGQMVLPRVDDEDHGKAYIYTLEGEFVCVARGIRHDGMSREEVRTVALAAKREQKNKLSAGRAALVQADKVMDVAQAPYERMLADKQRAERIEAQQPLRIQAMPYTSPTLEEAAKAVAAPVNTPAPVTDTERTFQKDAEAAIAKAMKDNLATATVETPEHRYLRAYNVEQNLLEESQGKGYRLPPEEYEWYERYQRTPEYDAQKKMHELFGDSRITNIAAR